MRRLQRGHIDRIMPCGTDTRLGLKKHGVKLGSCPFHQGLYPRLNEVPSERRLDLAPMCLAKTYVNMGPRLGHQPVGRAAGQGSAAAMSFADNRRIGESGARPRTANCRLATMQGRHFPISNGGVYGSLYVVAILNRASRAILEVHKIPGPPMAIHVRL